jgi:2-keto-4-pentenoate hydratase/2-oxohepta-3-ene-1,7-dioic acid hydratase in catechol pathway
MKLVTCEYQQSQRLGVVIGDQVVLPSLSNEASQAPTDMLELIAGGFPALDRLAAVVDQAPDAARVPLESVGLLAPIPRPTKNIMCLGWNYSEHAEESALASNRETKLPKHPMVFTKSVSSVNSPYGEFVADAQVSQELDWEVELGVIIGRGGRKIAIEDALSHVFGYTVINDISARDVQSRHKQFFLGKSLDGACPMGPWIVTADEIADPQNLDLRCWVNGELKQASNTRHQIFDLAKTLSILSRGMTLAPGDIISTGTPSGVGFARKPPEFLKPGDVVECEVEGIGKIKNRVVSAPS